MESDHPIISRLYKAYVEACRGSEYADIHDRRFVLVSYAQASYVLQLAGMSHHPYSPEILAAFNEAERMELHNELRPLRDAKYKLFETKGKYSKDIRASVTEAVAVALGHLDRAATVVTTTASIAGDPMFYAIRHAHLVIVKKPHD